ncbi:hypothetical protein M3197_12235 [Sporosarcina aquimarina]|uniref:hypothetical protein n=1 Tax=Sporosarcina aquimarina TaxID=114975 RepID=UPI00203C75B6|nr:hypothetical protein [Sporosarcina aquimarina]MCM3758232.1 hypothetical protein [Sporosarcina aquimarina]
MSSFTGIMSAILPLIIIGAIGVFVINRIDYMHKHGNQDEKNSKFTRDLLDSLMPLGLLFGCAIGITFSMFFSTSLLVAISVGAGIGFLIGYIVYNFYSKKAT